MRQGLLWAAREMGCKFNYYGLSTDPRDKRKYNYQHGTNMNSVRDQVPGSLDIWWPTPGLWLPLEHLCGWALLERS